MVRILHIFLPKAAMYTGLFNITIAHVYLTLSEMNEPGHVHVVQKDINDLLLPGPLQSLEKHPPVHKNSTCKQNLIFKQTSDINNSSAVNMLNAHL